MEKNGKKERVKATVQPRKKKKTEEACIFYRPIPIIGEIITGTRASINQKKEKLQYNFLFIFMYLLIFYN